MARFSYNPYYFSTTVPNIDDNPALREPQKIAYGHVFDHFRMQGKDSHAVVVLPTGVGKTGLMGLIPFGICQGRCLIITPQLVIKDAVLDSLDPSHPGNFWLSRGVLNLADMPCLIEYEGDETTSEILSMASIVVVNIQKCQGRLPSSLIRRAPRSFFDMVIVDEAHHSPAATWASTLQHFSEAKVVKLTGTPFRSDGQPILGDLVYECRLSSAMAHSYVKSLERHNHIPDQLYLTLDDDPNRRYTVDEILAMNLRDQDWINRSVAYSRECSERVVTASLEILADKRNGVRRIPHKIIAVACSIRHAEQIRDLYQAHGCPVAVVHSSMDKADRSAALSDIENHRVQAVVNVALLGEGYDHPYLSVAAIFRPFKSLLPYEQFIGRVLRAIPESDSPEAADNVAQVVHHEALNLGQLWEYYRNESQQADIIRHLESLDLDQQPDTIDSAEASNSHHCPEVGNAVEIGIGRIEIDPYVNTQILEQAKREEQEELQKVKTIQQLLRVSPEEAKAVVRQAKGRSQGWNRPDLYVKRKRRELDSMVREDLIPRLLQSFGLDTHAYDLQSCDKLLGGWSAWIKKNNPNNGALLGVYINSELKRMVGRDRGQWELSDWDRAERYRDTIHEFLVEVLTDFVNSR